MNAFKFESSSSDKTYTVQVAKDGTMSCNCPGWTRRVLPGGKRECRHTKEVTTRLATDVRLQRNIGKTAALVGAFNQSTAEGTFSQDGTRWTHDDFAEQLAEVEQDAAGYISPMLASPLEEHLETYQTDEWLLEEKFDGHRMIVKVETMKSVKAWARPRADRKVGIERDLPEHIVTVMKAFPSGVYDAELLVPGGWSANVTEVACRQDLLLMLFDVLVLDRENLTDRPYHERRKKLAAIGNALVNNAIQPGWEPDRAVQVSKVEKVSRAAVERIWARGGEGAILKNVNARYEPGKRSKQWIKVKKFETATLVVEGFEAGKMGPCSRVKLVSPDGAVRTTVKTKNNDWLRIFEAQGAAYIGRKLRIEHQGLKGGKFRHPMFDHFVEEK